MGGHHQVGLIDADLLQNIRETRQHRHGRGGVFPIGLRAWARNTPCGQRRRAVTVGIAEPTPNRRAS